MKTVLMIAPYFVPRRRVGSLRPFKFAIHLKTYGYKPAIITLGNPGSSLTERESELLKGIDIFNVNPPFDRTESPNQEKHFDGEQSTGISDSLMNWIDKQTPLDSWIYLFKARYSWILKYATKMNPDLIWATGDPWSGLWLGRKLSQDLTKPFIADFRDPWTLGNVNVRQRSAFSNGLDQEMEKKVVNAASKVIFTSRLTEKRYREHYNLPEEKSDTVYNSYDPTIIKQSSDVSWNRIEFPDHLNVIFFGRFRRLSPVTPIAEALKILKISNPTEASTILIHSFGQPDQKNLSLIRNYGLEKNFKFHKPVVPEEMLPVLKSADILLLSTNSEREEIIPAKLWDYLSVEIPIFSIAPNPEVSDIIMRSKAGIQVHPDHKEEIAELLGCFANAKINNESLLLSAEVELPDRKIYEASQTTKQLALIFDDIISDA